jgi:hypothetical protein
MRRFGGWADPESYVVNHLYFEDQTFAVIDLYRLQAIGYWLLWQDDGAEILKSSRPPYKKIKIRRKKIEDYTVPSRIDFEAWDGKFSQNRRPTKFGGSETRSPCKT